MSLPPSLFGLLFVQLAVGMLVFLPWLGEVGRGFARLMCVFALLFLLLLCGFSLTRAPAADGGLAAWGILGLVALLVLYQACLMTGREGLTKAFMWLSVAGSVAASFLYFQQFLPAGAPGWQSAVRMAGLYGSLGSLGAVVTAMILGHWYLVNFDLPIEPFKLMSIVLIVALVLRAVVTAGSVPLFEASAADYATRHAFVLLPRVLLGLIFPLVISVMTYFTVKIRSKQSATGLLYAAIVPILLGEAMGNFLFIATRVPV